MTTCPTKSGLIHPVAGAVPNGRHAGFSGETAMTRERDSEAVRLRGWRFDRSISLGHIFTATSIALSIAVPLVIWGSTVESRLSVLQTVHGLLAAHQERVAEDLKERLDR